MSDCLKGNLDVETSLNEPTYVVLQRIDKICINGKKDDSLLLYFFEHGWKEFGGALHLITYNTKHELYRSTGICANFINDLMQTSNSRRQVLILDCCSSGACLEEWFIVKEIEWRY